MRAVLIANIVGLVLAAIVMTLFFVLYIRAEWKLAKFGESSFFVKKSKNKDDRGNTDARNNKA